MNLNPSFDGPSAGQPEKDASGHMAPAYTPFKTSFASLSLHRSDRLRMLAFSQDNISGVRNVIQMHYRKGLQSEQPYAMSHEFKLRGYPWSGQGDDAIISRVIMREILAYLFSVGWIFHASKDVSKKAMDKDTLFFRKQQTLPPPSDWIAISFNRHDRLRLIGADPQLRQSFKNVLGQMRLLQSDIGWKDKTLGAWEFKLNGYPWYATGEETMSTRLLFLRMLECLEVHGWSMYASIDQNAVDSENSSETDTWYCVKDSNWVEGSAVFHR